MNKLNSLIKVAMVATGIAACAAQARAEEICTNCITFSADAPFGIKLNKGTHQETPTVTLEYSTDQLDWKTFNVDTGYNAKPDDTTYKLHIRGKGNSKFAAAFIIARAHCFTNTADSAATAIACSGNIMTLLDYEKVAKGAEPSMGECAFSCLFNGFAALTAAPELPATTLAKYCCRNMFSGCTSLKVAPELNATALAASCYGSMFNGCTSLTAAPALKATKLEQECYSAMFQGCTSLKVAPALPATTLAAKCYLHMFSGCTALTEAPELPATELKDGCYENMFYGCTSLKVAPALKATKLEQECYSAMFQGCTSLTAAPALPATELAKQCYSSMFQGCTSLTAAPALPATTLMENCYYGMFAGCTSLKVNSSAPGKEWKIPATTGEGATNWGKNMFKDTGGDIPSPPALNKPYYIASAPVELDVTEVAGATYAVTTNGAAATVPCTIDYVTPVDVVYTADAGYMFPGGYQTFETNLTANADEITVTVPAGQEPVAATTCEACLTFSADAAFGIKLVKKSSPAEPKLEYSQDQIYWSTFDLGNGAAAGADNKLYLRGTGNQQFAKDTTKYYAFTNTAGSAATAIACAGNTLTLLDYQTVAKGEEPTMGDYAFFKLFSGFAALTTAPELPATNLTVNCYNSMFYGCTKLAVAPELPATNLAVGCYYGMFSGCRSLTSAPALPAKKLAKGCYSYMFQGCTALTDVPELPATTLADGCYQSMFECCSALEVNAAAPGKEWKLPDAEEAEGWNEDMFNDTKGDVKKPNLDTTYYVKSALVPVTVVVPEVDGATAELYAFNVNGGWKTVEADKVPSNATVRVVWTADEGKGIWTNGVESAYQWQTAFGPVVGGEIAPAPEVREAGTSAVTVDLDTREDKRYFDAADVLPIWYAKGSEVKVQGQGQQWTTLVKSSANTNTLSWKPAADGVYTLSHTAFENATITLTTPVEVTTNGLEVAGTTVKVTDESGNPLVAQTEGEFAGQIIVPSNSTVKVTWTATGAGTYFMDGSTTYTQSFTADKPVNAVSEAVTKPAEPKAPSVKLGVVAQRYPWDGKLDVHYWAKNTPNEGYLLKVTATLPDGTEGSASVSALNGKNTMFFDMKRAFGEVTAAGVKVKAELEKEK